MRRRALIGGLIAIAACGALPSPAAAKGLPLEGAAANGVTVPGSPYRYAALSPGAGDVTVVVRTDRRRGGRIDRWWYLRGAWFIPAAAYDGSSGALSADGGTLVLRRFFTAYPPRPTRLAVLDTDVYLRHPRQPGEHRPAHAISRIIRSRRPAARRGLAARLDRLPARIREWLLRRPAAATPASQIRSLDLAEKRRLPTSSRPRSSTATRRSSRCAGLPISQATSADGRALHALRRRRANAGAVHPGHRHGRAAPRSASTCRGSSSRRPTSSCSSFASRTTAARCDCSPARRARAARPGG